MADTTITAVDDPWVRILDELEECVDRGEAGDLDSLAAWAAPVSAPALPQEHAARATGILDRQLRLMDGMRDKQHALSAEMSALRRPRFRTPDSLPVYIDRSA